MGAARAIPERTCIGCRGLASKADLLRIVRSATGVQVDPCGSAAGRGAYVHRRPDCLEAAARRGVVSRSLRVAIGEDELSKLNRDLRSEVRSE